MTDELDYNELDPGIRRFVRLLRSNGFETTDSGDGYSKVGGCALDVANVSMVVDEQLFFHEADRLLHLLLDWLPSVPFDAIQATYSPGDRTCVLSVYGIDDAMLREQP